MPAYGLLTFDRTLNLGDDIQSIAARRFLPRVDHHLDRERLDEAIVGDRPVRTIFNGWFMHDPAHWPPHDAIDPLLTSLHLAGAKRSWFFWPPRATAAEILLAPGKRDYFRRHGPVGARDPATLDALRRAGVEAYLSGCLTLTLPRATAERGDTIVACDVPPPVAAMLRARFGERLRVVSHLLDGFLPLEDRMTRAQALLDLYARARSVVTTRVHCALPCLALGTPVLYLPLRSDKGRKGIATDLAHHCSPRQFVRGAGYDPDAPPPNAERHLALSEPLAARCAAFVGAGA